MFVWDLTINTLTIIINNDLMVMQMVGFIVTLA